MGVSQRTAQRAVEAWNLRGGVVSFGKGCKCRFWSHRAAGMRLSRQVYYCELHRYRGPMNVRPQDG